VNRTDIVSSGGTDAPQRHPGREGRAIPHLNGTAPCLNGYDYDHGDTQAAALDALRRDLRRLVRLVRRLARRRPPTIGRIEHIAHVGRLVVGRPPVRPKPRGPLPPFTPTGLQQDILRALDGKALRTDALAHKADCDRGQMFRKGGLKELRERGLVAHCKELGFYRPDRPPCELNEPFVLSDLQRAILDALDGKGLRTDALAGACDVGRRQMFRKGGLKELEDRGRVSHHPRIGYYRPDKPPPEMECGEDGGGPSAG
jgi:hypothetical protein